MLFPLIFILLSCIVIWRASDGFESAADYLGRNLTDGVRGAAINAVGSSMPELFTTLWFLFAVHDSEGFAAGIGTTAGSAVFNGMIIPAVVILAVLGYGLARNITVSKKVILRDGLSLIAAEFILIVLITGNTIEWWHGLVLMLVYGVYVAVLLTTMTAAELSDDDVEPIEVGGSVRHNLLKLKLTPIFFKKGISSGRAWGLLAVSMLIIGGACALLVHSCEDLAGALGINTYFVAVIIASAATSVPDTILSYRDALSGKYDDAVANALGSNIFDICFALGFPLFVYTMLYGPIQMSDAVNEDITELRGLLLFATILAFLLFYIGRKMGRAKALALLGIYLAFTVFIFAKAYETPWAVELGEFIRNVLIVVT